MIYLFWFCCNADSSSVDCLCVALDWFGCLNCWMGC